LKKRDVMDLLRPLAYAQGEGLPGGSVWAQAASAASGISFRTRDIEILLEHAGYYIVQGAERGRVVYRLFHEALAEHLRHTDQSVEVHSAVADALINGTPAEKNKRDWSQAHPYTLLHLARH